jgi:hypothetical protein
VVTVTVDTVAAVQNGTATGNYQIVISIVRSIGGYKPPFPIPKRSPFLIRTHNELFSVAAMRVSNPDRSPVVERELASLQSF